MPKLPPVMGHCADLTRDRCVFVGRRGKNSTWYLLFRSDKDEYIRLKLTPEAMDAMLRMRALFDAENAPPQTAPPAPDIEHRWELVAIQPPETP